MPTYRSLLLLSSASLPITGSTLPPMDAMTLTMGGNGTVLLLIFRQAGKIHLDYSTVIRFFTPVTPFTLFTSLVAKSFSLMFLALPSKVTTPLFVLTEVLRTLVER